MPQPEESKPVVCSAKHTAYQPTEDEWKCPYCGANSDSFWIEEGAADANEDCVLLHNTDGATCTACGKWITGKAFAARLQKQHNLVPCEHCKGRGLVEKKSGGTGVTS